MASYTATIDWALQPGEDFVAGRYSRGHTVAFDGGVKGIFHTFAEDVVEQNAQRDTPVQRNLKRAIPSRR